MNDEPQRQSLHASDDPHAVATRRRAFPYRIAASTPATILLTALLGAIAVWSPALNEPFATSAVLGAASATMLALTAMRMETLGRRWTLPHSAVEWMMLVITAILCIGAFAASYLAVGNDRADLCLPLAAVTFAVLAALVWADERREAAATP